MEETEDVNARDQLDAGRVEVVVPTVDNELKPKLKMEFDSLDKGYSFYNNYSLASGFGIREHNSKNSSDGDCFVREEFVCCKKGKKRVDANPKPNQKVREGDDRTKCKAKLALYRELVVKSLL